MKRRDYERERLAEIVQTYAETIVESVRRGDPVARDLSKRPCVFFIGLRNPENLRYCGLGCARIHKNDAVPEGVQLFVKNIFNEDEGEEKVADYTIGSETIYKAIKVINLVNKIYAPDIDFCELYNYLHRFREYDQQWYESFPEIIGLGSVVEPYLEQVNKANELERKLRSIHAISIVKREE